MTARERQPNRGFTLIEVLMVIGIIGMALLVILPSVGKLFDSAADGQGRNLITAQLKAARSLAIRDRIHTGVHFQRHAETGDFWAAIVQVSTVDPDSSSDEWINLGDNFSLAEFQDIPLSPTGKFLVLAAGAQPVRFPGSVGVGAVLTKKNKVGVYWNLGNDYSDLWNWASQRNSDLPVTGIAGARLTDPFTTFTVVFDPDGRLVADLDENAFAFVRRGSDDNYYCSPLFVDRDPNNPPPPTDPPDTRSIWRLPKYTFMVTGKLYVDTCVKAICVFDATVYDNLQYKHKVGAGAVSKEAYLNDNAAFMPVAPYVGGLIRTSVD